MSDETFPSFPFLSLCKTEKLYSFLHGIWQTSCPFFFGCFFFLSADALGTPISPPFPPPPPPEKIYRAPFPLLTTIRMGFSSPPRFSHPPSLPAEFFAPPFPLFFFPAKTKHYPPFFGSWIFPPFFLYFWIPMAKTFFFFFLPHVRVPSPQSHSVLAFLSSPLLVLSDDDDANSPLFPPSFSKNNILFLPLRRCNGEFSPSFALFSNANPLTILFFPFPLSFLFQSWYDAPPFCGGTHKSPPSLLTL